MLGLCPKPRGLSLYDTKKGSKIKEAIRLPFSLNRKVLCSRTKKKVMSDFILTRLNKG